MKINYKRPPLAPYQKAILDSQARYTITAASTKAGKTASHIIWLFEQSLQGKKGQSFWWVAPVYGQAEIAFRRFKQQCSHRLFDANESKLRLTLPTGAMLEFKSAEKPDNLYGDDVYAAVFDEFTRAREEAWFALRSTLTKTRAKCKLIGNVKGKKNWGYRLAERARQGEDGYEFHKITAWDAVAAGILEKEEVEQAERDLPAHVFKELYLAEPADDDSNPFGLEHINGCIEPLAHGPIEYYGDFFGGEEKSITLDLTVTHRPDDDKSREDKLLADIAANEGNFEKQAELYKEYNAQAQASDQYNAEEKLRILEDTNNKIQQLNQRRIENEKQEIQNDLLGKEITYSEYFDNLKSLYDKELSDTDTTSPRAESQNQRQGLLA